MTVNREQRREHLGVCVSPTGPSHHPTDLILEGMRPSHLGRICGEGHGTRQEYSLSHPSGVLCLSPSWVSTVGSPQHLDPTSEGEPCHQEAGMVPEASQHRGGKGQLSNLPSTNGDREPGGVGHGALRLHRYGKGGLAPHWRDVVPQDALPGQKAAARQENNKVFFAGDYSCLDSATVPCLALVLRENRAAEAEFC